MRFPGDADVKRLISNYPPNPIACKVDDGGECLVVEGDCPISDSIEYVARNGTCDALLPIVFDDGLA